VWNRAALRGVLVALADLPERLRHELHLFQVEPRVAAVASNRGGADELNDGPDLMIENGDVYLAQQDGNLPTVLAAGSAPGEGGVSVLSMRFEEGAHFSATPRQHLICFQLSQLPIECRMAGRSMWHEPLAGSLAVCPAGMDCAADTEQSTDIVLIAVDPGQLALAAAEDLALEVRLIERFSAFDRALLGIANGLAMESANNYPSGALFWNDLASCFMEGLVARHTSAQERHARGLLSKIVLKRLKEYVLAHLNEQIAVEALAAIAGRSPFHFTRVFTRSVGVTPHRYVVHLRLQRAIELVRGGQSGFADIAACTGFADQSHLSRWVRRVHGVSLSHLASST
jgi:AraC family transcriptional regulator